MGARISICVHYDLFFTIYGPTSFFFLSSLTPSLVFSGLSVNLIQSPCCDCLVVDDRSSLQRDYPDRYLIIIKAGRMLQLVICIVLICVSGAADPD